MTPDMKTMIACVHATTQQQLCTDRDYIDYEEWSEKTASAKTNAPACKILIGIGKCSCIAGMPIVAPGSGLMRAHHNVVACHWLACLSLACIPLI